MIEFEGETPFLCLHCWKSFSSHIDLKLHIKVIDFHPLFSLLSLSVSLSLLAFFSRDEDPIFLPRIRIRLSWKKIRIRIKFDIITIIVCLNFLILVYISFKWRWFHQAVVTGRIQIQWKKNRIRRSKNTDPTGSGSSSLLFLRLPLPSRLVRLTVWL